MSSSQPDSPKQRRLHGDDIKQEKLDEEAAHAIEAAGGFNFLQTKFLLETCRDIHESDYPNLVALKDKPRIQTSKAWHKALCIALAYLKRHKMTETVETLKIEYPDAPKATGFQRGTELDLAMTEVLKTSDRLFNKTFPLRIQEIEDQIKPLMKSLE